MRARANRASAPSSESFDVARPAPALDITGTLRQIALARGMAHLDLLKDYAALAFGPGQLSFGEYVSMRVFDVPSRAEKRCFAGLKAWCRILAQVNYRRDWWGLMAHKIASTAFLAAYGLPIIPAKAIFCPELTLAATPVLRTAEELRAFLADGRNYPLFGKPVEGLQSLGSASLARYDPATDHLVTTVGEAIRLESFIADVMSHYGAGYLFQKRVTPHPEIARICGDRLATLRLLTILRQDGPKLLRACWKIPAGRNTADNFWRAGNLLAGLDLATGRVVRAFSGTGLALSELAHHPDSGAPIVGVSIPHWNEVRRLACEGARILKEVALIGWDVAVTEAGPVVVEVNETPDFLLPQLADGRGLLDEEFLDFLAERKRHAAAWKRQWAAQNLR